MLTKINKLVEQTQYITQYPPEVVSEVIQFMFQYIRNFLLNPDAAGLRLPHIGVISPNNNTIDHYLKSKLIPRLKREREDEYLKSVFKKIWKLRQVVRKKEDSRNFKKRFGSWHYKSIE